MQAHDWINGVIRVDVAAASQAVAVMAASGAVSGLSESAALSVVGGIRKRVREVFGSDDRSVSALEDAIQNPAKDGRVRELAATLAWYARRDGVFAGELAGWAQQYTLSSSVVQNVLPGRDGFTAGRDMTVNYRHDSSE